MTEFEQQARAFASQQTPCPRSGRCPRLFWGGILVIACKDDCQCSINDPDNIDPSEITRKWEAHKDILQRS